MEICPGVPFCAGGPDCPQHRNPSEPATAVVDLVNEPPHYRSLVAVTLKSGKKIDAGELEAIDVQDAFDLDRYLSNVVKYCLRAGRKGPDVEDLKKARMLLTRRIERAERGE